MSPAQRYILIAMALASAFLASDCLRAHERRIALIPRTTGSAFWEAEHAGALLAARDLHCKVYWNAPQREDDVNSQITLVDRITAEHYDGLILAPAHSLALLTPVRRALAAGVPVVLVSSGLAMPPSQSLSCILSDDEEGGRMAAQRAATILNGKGLIAIVGVDPDVNGIMERARSIERAVAEGYPQLRLVAMGPGAFNAAEAQQSFLTILNENPSLQCVVGLTTVSTRAVYSVLKGSKRLGKVKLIGFEQDSEMTTAVREGEVDSLVAENMYQMGIAAVTELRRKWEGKQVESKLLMRPVLITQQNVNSPEIRTLTRSDWFALQ